MKKHFLSVLAVCLALAATMLLGACIKEVPEKAEYKTEHYFETVEGEFEVDAALTETATVEAGTVVTGQPASKEGYVFDSENANNVTTATVAEDGSTVLKFYYVFATASYATEYYFEDLNGEFVCDAALTETATAKVGTQVTAAEAVKEGFVFDSENANNVTALTVSEGENTLKLYYSRKTFTLTVVGATVEEKTVKYGETVDLGGESVYTWAVTDGTAELNGTVLTVGNSNVTVKADLINNVLFTEAFTGVEDTVTATFAGNDVKQGIVFLYNVANMQNYVGAKDEFYFFYTQDGKINLVKSVDGVETVLASNDVALSNGENKYSVVFNAQGITGFVNDTQVIVYETAINFGGRVAVYQENGVPAADSIAVKTGMELQAVKEYAVYVMTTLHMNVYKLQEGWVKKVSNMFAAENYSDLSDSVAAAVEGVNALESVSAIEAFVKAENGAIKTEMSLHANWNSVVDLAKDFTATYLLPYVGYTAETGHITTTNADGAVLSTDVLADDARWYIPDALRVNALINHYFYNELTAATTTEGYMAVVDKYVVDVVKATALNNYEFWYWFNRNSGKSVANEWWYLWTCIGVEGEFVYNGCVTGYVWAGQFRLTNGLYSCTDYDTIVSNFVWMRDNQTLA